MFSVTGHKNLTCFCASKRKTLLCCQNCKRLPAGASPFEAEGQANCPQLGLQAVLMPGIEEVLSSFPEVGFQEFQVNNSSLIKWVEVHLTGPWEVSPQGVIHLCKKQICAFTYGLLNRVKNPGEERRQVSFEIC